MFIQPVLSLNIVLGPGGFRAARTCAAVGRAAQVVEEIVGRAVLLKDDDDVLETGNLRGREDRSE